MCVDRCTVGRQDVCKYCKRYHYDIAVWGSCCSHYGIEVDPSDSCNEFVCEDVCDNSQKVHCRVIAGASRVLERLLEKCKGMIYLIVCKAKKELWQK